MRWKTLLTKTLNIKRKTTIVKLTNWRNWGIRKENPIIRIKIFKGTVLDKEKLKVKCIRIILVLIQEDKSVENHLLITCKKDLKTRLRYPDLWTILLLSYEPYQHQSLRSSSTIKVKSQVVLIRFIWFLLASWVSKFQDPLPSQSNFSNKLSWVLFLILSK